MPTTPRVSNAFQAFFDEAPGHARAWMGAVEGLGQASALDPKTRALAYLAVVAAARITSGVAFHVKHARARGQPRRGGERPVGRAPRCWSRGHRRAARGPGGLRRAVSERC